MKFLKHILGKNESEEEKISEEQQLLNEARDQASQIINDAQLFTKHSEDQIKQAIAHQTKHMTAKAEQELGLITEAFKHQSEEVYRKLGLAARDELKALRKFSEQQVAQINIDLNREAEASRKSLADQIRSKRRTQLKSVAAQINEHLPEIVKRATSKAIKIEDHEDLVLDALNKVSAEKIW